MFLNVSWVATIIINQRGDISTLSGGALNLVGKFTYLGSSISSTENDINSWLAKAWATINMLSFIWKSDLSDKIKHNFFPSSGRIPTTVWMHHLNTKYTVYLTNRQDPIRDYHSGSEWTLEWWQWRCTPHSPKLQRYWNLTIKLFSVISRILVGGFLLFCRDAVCVFYSPSRLGNSSYFPEIPIGSSLWR